MLRLFDYIYENALVAELVDALDSKSSIREGVWVRVPPSAPKKSSRLIINWAVVFFGD